MGRSCAAVFVLMLLVATGCYAAKQADGISIVNKAHLPPARLAEAIAAKAVLLYDASVEQKKLLLTAANTAPGNPMYPYLLARTKCKWNEDSSDYDYAPSRPLLERSLKANPNYLPALYAYAMSEPTHGQRMAALQRMVGIDEDNAEPYYLMALERFCKITKGRKITTSSDCEAFEMSQQEWEQISDLIEKGNQCSIFEWRSASVPSTHDIRISTHAKAWPAKAVQNHLELMLDLWGGSADGQYSPHNPVGGAIWRQLARQAKWAAKVASKIGDKDKALHYLTVITGLGYKYSNCLPERMDTFLMGYAIWSMVEREAEGVLKQKTDADALADLKKKKAEWKNACGQCKPLINKTYITVKSIRYLTYIDFGIEEAGVRKILAGLRP